MPNNDYIKRSDALKVLCDKCVFEPRCSRENEFCNQVLGIKAIPAADVAPPIRCAECRYFRRGGNPDGFGWCDRPGAGCSLPEDYYCKYGTKKEADNG